MPIVSGNVYFDATLNNTGTVGIANVPVVLQNTSTNVGLVVLTDASGAFVFNGVPAGTYRLVESWGFPGGVATPGNFALASVIAVPVGEDPPASAITSPPANTNLIESVNRNTITPISVSTVDVTGQIFRDGPYTEKPLVISDVSYVGSNLVTAAANGTWGTLPAGTSVETRPASAPYPTAVTGFTYTNVIPPDGSYTVTNTANAFGGGFIADHTQGDETGRYQIVNGANPGNSFFTDTVNVTPNKFYQFSAWMLNLTAGASPQLGYQIKTTGGTIIFQQNAPAVTLTSPRTWLQLGTFFNSGNNSQLVINLLSQGPAAGGNDYAIDDIALIQATVNNILTINKSTNKDFANVGDIIDYQVVMKNIGNSTITNLVFVDTIPTGTSFNTGTVQVNGTTVPAANPASFSIPTPPMPMTPNEVFTVTYKVTVNTIPSINPIPNSATANYAFAPENGGATVPMGISSNIVATKINNGDISTKKLVDKAYANIGDNLTYTIPLRNYGNVSASNIILIDTIPAGTVFINDSLFIDSIAQPGLNPSPPTGVALGSLNPGVTKTVAFKVLVVTLPTINPITNNGTINYNFIVDPSLPTIKASGVTTNPVNTKVNVALVASSKIVNKAFANVGDTLTYTVTFKNIGNVSANTLNFVDTIPNDTTFVTNSVTFNGTTQPGLNPNPPGFTIASSPLPIGVNGTFTISFKVIVNTIPSPNPIPNSASGVYTFTVDPSVPNGGTLNYNTNVVSTQVNRANLGNATKYVDKNYANCGDTINYVIVIPNSGNVTAENVVFKDTIPIGTTFVTNSVTVNGTQQSGANPSLGVAVPNIAPGGSATITFAVQVQC